MRELRTAAGLLIRAMGIALTELGDAIRQAPEEEESQSIEVHIHPEIGDHDFLRGARTRGHAGPERGACR